MIKIASFNVENLYARPKAFGFTDMSVAAPYLAAHAEVNELFGKETYSAADKRRMLVLLEKLDIYRKNDQGVLRKRNSTDPEWAWLRKNRGKFDVQPKEATDPVYITANGRADWVGWVELATETVDEVGFQTTARVIRDVDAHIFGIVEAENRPNLVRFRDDMLQGHYKHVMVLDGNDDRGIDVGLITKPGFVIENIRSNVDLEDDKGIVFSRDCPQYEVRTPGGNHIHVLVNHFKSKSGGGGDKRLRQATAVRAIVDGLVAQGKHVVVLGDLNEGPQAGKTQAENLAPLYSNNSPLVDCWSLGAFDYGERPGSYDSCGLSDRLDYIFLSKSLANKVTAGGLFREGLWGDRKSPPDKWDTYPEMTGQHQQASDHACVWVEVEVD
ncbi:MAG: endonuclease/exonuclease/phosphatase family protein [Flavobacteriales bacterium]|nr:endonuclease/exonuclease/phosphatase family protein [Flavobacteriales bacterium]